MSGHIKDSLWTSSLFELMDKARKEGKESVSFKDVDKLVLEKSKACTWEKVDGRFICQAKHCPHWSENGCRLGKVSLSCDNDDCRWRNEEGHCGCMDVHLDADGKCLGVVVK